MRFTRCLLCDGRRPLRKLRREGGVAYCRNEAACRRTAVRIHHRWLRDALGAHSNEHGAVYSAQKRVAPHARSGRRGIHGSRWWKTQSMRRVSP